jgi:small subunit ribosomal protein S8
MVTDPIADYLTRVRNGIIAGHKVVEVPASNLKQKITEILYNQGYILNYKVEEDKGPQGTIKIALKYDKVSQASAIKSLERVSKPGLRTYKSSSDLPRVINGLGIAIISTSRGIMTDKKARKENVGGEVLCYVY